MNTRYGLWALSTLLLLCSCEKLAGNRIIIEGVVRDAASGAPVPGVRISVDAIKPSSGWGIITDGRREGVAAAITDNEGYYNVSFKVFHGAQYLDFFLSPADPNAYTSNLETMHEIPRGETLRDFEISPIGLLKISFKNVNPVSDDDFFYFNWFNNGKGWVNGQAVRENCGTIQVSDAVTWKGKDVCGVWTVQTIAESTTRISWTVEKNGIRKEYRDSIFVKRDKTAEYVLNY
ncbi:MAG: carboxypeptidase regulatory-like domain-containing protein [Chitinophagaceae bacterium]|nr:carboxypeptidase regulatory-like domain-containing protein [Chitinophagaceae bacterium]MCW5928142.1 carboxypeptidase regulatory-like domain-containing protein [Chitinophagaceae bacterium]